MLHGMQNLHLESRLVKNWIWKCNRVSRLLFVNYFENKCLVCIRKWLCESGHVIWNGVSRLGGPQNINIYSVEGKSWAARVANYAIVSGASCSEFWRYDTTTWTAQHSFPIECRPEIFEPQCSELQPCVTSNFNTNTLWDWLFRISGWPVDSRHSSLVEHITSCVVH